MIHQLEGRSFSSIRAFRLVIGLVGFSPFLSGCKILDALAPEGEYGGPTVRVRQQWHAPHTGYANPQPALMGDLVFVATGDGRVIARERARGRKRWAARVGTDRPEAANLIARAGVVVAPVLFHTVGLDAATGAELWRYEAPLDTVDGGPRTPGQLLRVRLDADEQAVYVPAWGGTIASVELRTGHMRWRWQPEPEIAHRFGAQGVRVSGGTVFATVWHFLNATGTQAEAWVVALDAATGRQLWRTVLPVGLSGVSVAGRPEVTPDGVVAMTVSGDLFSLDRATGRIMWHIPRQPPSPNAIGYPVFASPAVADNTVYADDGFSGLRALRSSDGKLLWRTPYLGGQFVDDLLVTPTRIYGPAGQLHAFDRRAGAWLGMVGQPGKTGYDSFFPATPAASDGQVFAPYEGGILAFSDS